MMSAPVASEVDLWALYDLDFADELPCDSIHRFMLYLRSPSTEWAQARMSVHSRFCEVVLYGPVADCPTTDESGRKWERLSISYKLTADEVHNRQKGLDRAEKVSLVILMREKIRGADMKLFCNSLNLPRVQ
jgi:hypothetical protein